MKIKGVLKTWEKEDVVKGYGKNLQRQKEYVEKHIVYVEEDGKNYRIKVYQKHGFDSDFWGTETYGVADIEEVEKLPRFEFSMDKNVDISIHDIMTCGNEFEIPGIIYASLSRSPDHNEEKVKPLYQLETA